MNKCSEIVILYGLETLTLGSLGATDPRVSDSHRHCKTLSLL